MYSDQGRVGALLENGSIFDDSSPKRRRFPRCGQLVNAMDKVLTGKLTFHSLKPCDLSKTNKGEIKAYFENSYNLDESLFTSLKDESVFYKCPDRLRLPLIFYYGHTACVYVNKLILADLIKPEERINLELETIFETGVDEMSWDDTENYRMGGKYKWPALDDVIEYRRRVRKLIIDCIEKTELELPITMDSQWWGLFMGMEHERIHVETSSVLICQLPVDMVQKPRGYMYGPSKGPLPVEENSMLSVSAQEVVLGKPWDFPSYGWDNEYGKRHCKVPAFMASKYLITNKEFLEFVQAEGYQRKEFWTDEGWKWKEFCKACHPLFWVCDKGCVPRCGENLGKFTHCRTDPKIEPCLNHLPNGINSYCNGHETTDDNGHQASDEGGGFPYRLRCMFDVIPMALDWPVQVNYHEAKAYSSWRGCYRLPSEAEHYLMRGNMPVNLFPPTDLGFHDVMGNVWEWTEDHFNGLPGFKTMPLYDDFSGPCFDGLHNIIMGGSWISTGDEASRFARFGFRRHFMQHCGFRVVKSLDDKLKKHPICIINTPVYVQNHGIIDNEVPLMNELVIEPVPSTYANYASDTVENMLNHLKQEYVHEGFTHHILEQVWIKQWLKTYDIERRRFLHLGCGAGDLSFRLGALCDQLLATDPSAYLIDACLRLQSGETVKVPDDGSTVPVAAPVANGENIVFKQFTWLPNEVGFFDMVVAALFDRVQDMTAWALRLREIVNKRGLIVVMSTNENTEQHLAPIFGKRFNRVDSREFSITDGVKKIITAWIRQ
ncbi:hypothetical protein LSH36_1699g00008 [Paralvinella palmiformis]|uniref:Sulfatase-modifying factor enzyme-like domain-containing protein n=1 Tax=Paralvinella palmiformis TaxID=53620 RepID=A0AAD9IS04_9ANNE|nr:hypothetical protein LSH36_1699g00008 [Paralvinella palmiformis]